MSPFPRPATGPNAPRRTGPPAGGLPRPAVTSDVTKLTVNIGPETRRALELVMAVDDVNLTEALRRLVTYGAIVHRTIKLDHKKVLLADMNSGTTLDVTIA